MSHAEHRAANPVAQEHENDSNAVKYATAFLRTFIEGSLLSARFRIALSSFPSRKEEFDPPSLRSRAFCSFSDASWSAAFHEVRSSRTSSLREDTSSKRGMCRVLEREDPPIVKRCSGRSPRMTTRTSAASATRVAAQERRASQSQQPRTRNPRITVSRQTLEDLEVDELAAYRKETS